MNYPQSILDKIAEKRRASRPKSARQRVLEEVRNMKNEPKKTRQGNTSMKKSGHQLFKKRDMTNIQGFDMDFYNKFIQIYPGK